MLPIIKINTYCVHYYTIITWKLLVIPCVLLYLEWILTTLAKYFEEIIQDKSYSNIAKKKKKKG